MNKHFRLLERFLCILRSSERLERCSRGVGVIPTQRAACNNVDYSLSPVT